MDCPYLPWARVGVAGVKTLYIPDTHVDFRSVVCEVLFPSSQIVRKLLWADGRKSVSP